MPKPIEGINGSGLHANLSLMDAEGNAFSDHNDENAISTTAYKFLSGILNHASAFTAITNPTVNSYKRLVPGYEAPVYIAFSKSNRSCFVRIPGVPGNASRIEVRSVDATCNPYLAIAVLLAAGLEGIKSTDSKMPEAEQIDLFTKTLDEVKAMGIEALPESLEHALYRLEKDSVIIDALGLTIYENFRAIK